jgi:hypothetical protein
MDMDWRRCWGLECVGLAMMCTARADVAVQTVEMECFWWNNTVPVCFIVMLNLAAIRKNQHKVRHDAMHNFSCPESNFLQPKCNMFTWSVGVDIAPMVQTPMFSTAKFLLHQT